MTNLVVAITLALATNWTGYTFGTNELGYVLTNHVARIEYAGITNEYTLKSEPGNVAVWKPKQVWFSYTNSIQWSLPVWTIFSFTGASLAGAGSSTIDTLQFQRQFPFKT